MTGNAYIVSMRTTKMSIETWCQQYRRPSNRCHHLPCFMDLGRTQCRMSQRCPIYSQVRGISLTQLWWLIILNKHTISASKMLRLISLAILREWLLKLWSLLSNLKVTSWVTKTTFKTILSLRKLMIVDQHSAILSNTFSVLVSSMMSKKPSISLQELFLFLSRFMLFKLRTTILRVMTLMYPSLRTSASSYLKKEIANSWESSSTRI